MKFLFFFLSFSALASCPDLNGEYARCVGTTGELTDYSNLSITQAVSESGVTTYQLDYVQLDTPYATTLKADGVETESSEPSPMGEVKTVTSAKCESGTLIVEETVSVPTGVLATHRREFRNSGELLTIKSDAKVMNTRLADTFHCQ